MLVRQSNRCPLCGTTLNPQYFGKYTSLNLSAKNQATFVKCCGLAELLGDHASQARVHSTIAFLLFHILSLNKQSRDAEGSTAACRLGSSCVPFPQVVSK